MRMLNQAFEDVAAFDEFKRALREPAHKRFVATENAAEGENRAARRARERREKADTARRAKQASRIR